MVENYRQLHYTSDDINEKRGKVDTLPSLEKEVHANKKEISSIKGDGYSIEGIKPT